MTIDDGLNGWHDSADAWIASLGEQGDWVRRTFLDDVMMALVKTRHGMFLDVGCGEGRFSRKLRQLGLQGVGIDPVARLIEWARQCDPDGDYRIGFGEQLDFADGSFDLVVSYLSLIDIEDFRTAITEMARVVKPGGMVIVANLSAHFSAGRWRRGPTGAGESFVIDNYHQERATREQWADIDILNWHRPLSSYFQQFIACGLSLSHFSEPMPRDQGDEKSDRYTRVPAFVVMQWDKPI